MPLISLNRSNVWPAQPLLQLEWGNPLCDKIAEVFMFGGGNRVGAAFGKVLTLTGGASFTPYGFGKVGSAQAITFDALTNFGELPLDLGAFGTGAFSVTALVRVDAALNRTFIGNNRSGTASGWLLSTNSSGTATINTAASFATNLTTTRQVFEAGVPHFFTLTRDTSGKYSWFVDGFADATATTTAYDVNSGFLPMFGAQRTTTTPTGYFYGGCGFLALHRRAISLVEHQRLMADMGQILKAPPRRIWTGAGSSGTVIAPGVGHLVWQGYAPTVTRTANQAVAPGTGHLTWQGYAPTVTRTAGQAVAPGTGHLTWRGYAPTISQTANQAVAPGVGHLAWHGYAPTITQGAGQIIAPGTGHLAWRGYAPTVTRTANQAVTPGVGHLAWHGYAPTVTQGAGQVVAPGAGHLVWRGYAPTVTRTAGQVVAPGVGHLTWHGYAPALTRTANQVIAPGVGHLTWHGYAPTIAQGPAVPLSRSTIREVFGPQLRGAIQGSALREGIKG